MGMFVLLFLAQISSFAQEQLLLKETFTREYFGFSSAAMPPTHIRRSLPATLSAVHWSRLCEPLSPGDFPRDEFCRYDSRNSGCGDRIGR